MHDGKIKGLTFHDGNDKDNFERRPWASKVKSYIFILLDSGHARLFAANYLNLCSRSVKSYFCLHIQEVLL